MFLPMKNTETERVFTSPDMMRSALDAVPISIVVLDPRRRIVFMNRACEALTGFTSRDVYGLPCYQVLRNRVCFENCPIARLDEGTEPMSVESDLINKTRERIPVRITLAPLKDAHGKVAGFLESLEDMRFLRKLDGKMRQGFSFGQIVGRSPQMEKIFRMLPFVAQSDSSVLITGETGTGKDLVAEAIHNASSRAKAPFVKVNCGALPETLLESEIFGHKKGAFTGALEDKPGRFRLAHNGSLYLTEIGDLPLPLQTKLLTFLDDQVVYPLGSTKGFQANVRIIAATHRNLEEMVREGRFREDLFFRLNVVRIHLPPLREREGDIRLLLDHFLRTLAGQFKKNIESFSDNALELLLHYEYPGNVRELRNIVEYAANVCEHGRIDRTDLPTYLEEGDALRKEREAEPPSLKTLEGYALDGAQTWDATERKMILEALIKAAGKRKEAARLLGWGRSTLWRKMKLHGIH
jgi:PAS domain S-box-containing protein